MWWRIRYAAWNFLGITAILVKQEKQMATLQQIKDKLAQLGTDVQTLINRPAGASDADLQPVADAIDALDTSVKAALGQ